MRSVLSFSVLILFIFMSGCGSSSKANDTESRVIDNSKLQFIPPFTVEVEENQEVVIKLKAVGCTDKPRYEINDDEFIFNCNPSTGLVKFKEVPKYEVQHTYKFIAVATGCVDKKVEQEIIIKIKKPEDESLTENDILLEIFLNKWKLEKLILDGNFKWIVKKHVYYNGYTICDKNNELKCLNIEKGKLSSNLIQSSTLSAVWNFKSLDNEYVYIQNEWKNDIYLHLENTYLEAGKIELGWWSSMWKRLSP